MPLTIYDEKLSAYYRALDTCFDVDYEPDGSGYILSAKEDVYNEEKWSAALHDLGFYKTICDDDVEPPIVYDEIYFDKLVHTLEVYSPPKDDCRFGYRVATVLNKYFGDGHPW